MPVTETRPLVLNAPIPLDVAAALALFSGAEGLVRFLTASGATGAPGGFLARWAAVTGARVPS